MNSDHSTAGTMGGLLQDPVLGVSGGACLMTLLTVRTYATFYLRTYFDY